VSIRTFQPGDESTQVAIYNEAAAGLPKFKPATLPEVQRRSTARDFDAGMRFFAIENGKAVGYATFNANGRVSFPWCVKGQEAHAEPLFAHVLKTMRQRGVIQAFAAYRGDWPAINDFFVGHAFTLAREMVNFVVDLVGMPTIPARPSSSIGPLERADIPAILELAPQSLRVRTAAELEKHLFSNPYFTPQSLFALRPRSGPGLVGAGVLVQEPTYADPKQVDSAMPCFRLGAFGTETMQVKRIKGLFSFVARNDKDATAVGLDLMGHAALLLQDNDDIDNLAAQVPSDVPHLLRFYSLNFRRQGSFPVFERDLTK